MAGGPVFIAPPCTCKIWTVTQTEVQ